MARPSLRRVRSRSFRDTAGTLERIESGGACPEARPPSTVSPLPPTSQDRHMSLRPGTVTSTRRRLRARSVVAALVLALLPIAAVGAAEMPQAPIREVGAL